MASLIAPAGMGRRTALAVIAGAAIAVTGALAPSAATGQLRTAHLAPGVLGVAASVRCPLDMTVRIETPRYVARLIVTQDRTPILPNEMFPRPRLVHADITILPKGAGLRATQGTDPDLRLPTQVHFNQWSAVGRIRMLLPHQRELQPAHVTDIRALGTDMLQQIRALAPQICAPGATDGTMTLTADDQRIQPILASVERLYRRSLPPARVTALE